MKAAIAFLMTVTFSAGALAQDYIEIFSVSHTQQIQGAVGALPSDSPYQGSAIDILLPIPLSERTALITGINIDQSTPQHSERICPTLVGGLWKAGMNIQHTEKLAITYLLLPKFAGTSAVDVRNQLQLGGVVLAKYVNRPKLHYKAGIYINHEYYGPLVVPVAGVFYQGARIYVNALLPLNGELGIQIKESKNHVGFHFEGINRSYKHGSEHYVEKANNEIGIFGMRSIGNLHCKVTIGQSIGRRFRRFESNDQSTLAFPLFKLGDQRTALAESKPNGLFLKFGISYRIPNPTPS
jgi:hypothetical protein